MQLHVLIIATIATFAVTVNGYCDYKSREVHAELSKTMLKASRHLQKAQDEDGKWINLHTTGYALAVLKLLGYDLREETDAQQLFEKAAGYFENAKGDITTANGGELAYIIMGLNALNIDPSDYKGMNLTKNLLRDLNAFPKGKFNHYFQYSLALMALGINDVRVEWQAVKKILDKVEMILRTGAKHSKDTCALFVMALQSVVHQFQEKLQVQWINKIITQLSNTLAMKTRVGIDNHNTISLVMQARSAVGKEMGWEATKCEKTYNYFFTQKGEDGAFGNLGTLLNVLPALAGVSFLDLKKKPGEGNGSNGIQGKEQIVVSVAIEFEATGKQSPKPQVVEIVNGSTVLQALTAAAAKHHCYKFETRNSAFGEYLIGLCKNYAIHSKKIYWVFLVNDKMPNVGIGSYVLKNGDSVTFKYKQYK